MHAYTYVNIWICRVYTWIYHVYEYTCIYRINGYTQNTNEDTLYIHAYNVHTK